jgi:glycosyltransferase involved in cell wall biosynthesis
MRQPTAIEISTEPGRDRPLRVTYVLRKPAPGHQYFSIERLFDDVSSNLPADIHAVIRRCRVFGRGVLRRLLIAVESAFIHGDIVHVTGDIHFATILCGKRRTILTIHDLLVYHRCRGALKRWVYRTIWLNLSTARCAVVTVVSETTRRDLLANCRVDPSKVRVVHNCVSPSFTHCPREFNADCPRILQIGTKPNKNVERVIEAVAGIPCHLRIVGATTEQQRSLLHEMSVAHSEVAAISDEAMVEEYRRADLVVFASLSEGFGLPIVEAQATGRVIVTSDRTPMTEIAGDGALYANPEDAESIKAAIMAAIGDAALRARLIAAGLRNVERFSATKIAGLYAEIYREMSGASRGH